MSLYPYLCSVPSRRSVRYSRCCVIRAQMLQYKTRHLHCERTIKPIR